MRMSLAAVVLTTALGLAACGTEHKTIVVTPDSNSTVVVQPTDGSGTTVVVPPSQ